MARTRSQTGNIAVKREEEDVKPTLGSENVRNRRSSARISKRKPPVTNNGSLPAQQVKVEEDIDTKSLLKPTPNSSKIRKGQKISQEQINQLIDYIEQVGKLIKYITQDKMTIKEASVKANMDYASAHRYYHKYLEDPNHNIPIARPFQTYTQDQREAFIHYVINDKMSIAAASKKARLNHTTAKDYYRNYFKVQNPNIPTPSHIVTRRCYTQEQIKELISYIVDDRMTIAAASRKTNMSPSTAIKYYQQYLKDNNMEAPVSKMGCIVDDKMTVKAASKKANKHEITGGKYYRQYLKDHNLDVPIPKIYTQEQKVS